MQLVGFIAQAMTHTVANLIRRSMSGTPLISEGALLFFATSFTGGSPSGAQSGVEAASVVGDLRRRVACWLFDGRQGDTVSQLRRQAELMSVYDHGRRQGGSPVRRRVIREEEVRQVVGPVRSAFVCATAHRG